MCGIFSLYISNTFSQHSSQIQKYIESLCTLTQTRGMDATGIALHHIQKNTVHLYNEPLKASQFIKTKGFKNLIKNHSQPGLCVVGHTRLATHGSSGYLHNNQPIYNEHIVCAQNGIVTNLNELSPLFNKKYELDTYFLLDFFTKNYTKTANLKKILQKLFHTIEGENNILYKIPEHRKLIHTTNTGSIYYMDLLNQGIFVTASEYYILKKFTTQFKLKADIKNLKKHHILILDYENNLIDVGPLSEAIDEISPFKAFTHTHKIIDLETQFFEKLDALRRCKKCILPETFPGIFFHEDGICNVCKNYQKISLKDIQSLETIFNQHRKSEDKPDCLVAFSGGRDSSYALHLIKTKYHMNPVAYSYDWGMVTDLARRNQARLCGKLGIEHIWVSADIAKKNKNIKKNIEAWIKKPHIGMVPIFMAGDKTYFYHAKQVMKKMGLNLIIFSPNNLERTDFKAGYCGIKSSNAKKQVHQLAWANKLKLLKFYAKQYLTNPYYLNSSIIDSAAAFFSYYIIKQNFLYFFDYEKWDENEVDQLLTSEYQWEREESYPSSWRIGDGTAPLYNFIYFLYGGFTENDCLRSNQIRENMIVRESALIKCTQENIPRLKAIEDYCKKVNVDFVSLINATRKIKYNHE